MPELKDLSPFFHHSSYDLFELLTLNYEYGSPRELPLGKFE